MSTKASPSPSVAPHTQASADSAQQLLQIATAFMPAACLSVATSLSIADHLAHGPKSVEELAQTTGTHEQSLYRILRALASIGIFSEVGLRYFANTPISEHLRSGPGSPKNLLNFMLDEFHFKVWGNIMYSARTGRPAVEKVYGKPCFDLFEDDPDLAARFNAAMTSLSATIVPTVLEVYDFSGIRTLVDVAGGRGFTLTSILKQYPQMRGILFEMPYLLESAKELIREAGVQDRCTTVAGDFFQEIVPGGDAYYMQHIIHDWDDEKAITILNTVRTALGSHRHGKVLIVDSVVQQGDQPDFAKMMDLEMLLMPGGCERTEEQFGDLLSAAGFRLNRIVRTKGTKCVIEGVLA